MALLFELFLSSISLHSLGEKDGLLPNLRLDSDGMDSACQNSTH